MDLNIRGICIDKTKIKLLNDKKNKLTKNMLQALDVFNSFNWKNFKKDEFFQILNSLDVFLKNSKLPENQLFVTFYETDVTEMDAVTVLEKENKPIFIDFEIKNGDENILKSSIISQIKKRKDNAMPQLFKDSKYLIIGIVNDKIYSSCFFDGEDDKWFVGDDVYNLIEELKGYEHVNEFLYQVNNMDSIVNVFNKIEKNSFKYFDDVKSITENFVKRLNERKDENGIICYGNAGCGKTVMALKLFFELENTKLLILNPKLYFSLNLTYYYYQNKASYKTTDVLENLNDEDILIIDEAQRLDKNQILDIVNSGNKIIFFGDDKQSFGEHGNLFTSLELRKFIEENTNKKFYIRNLKKSKRYSDEVSTIIENLTSLTPHRIKNVNDYEVNIFCANEEEFIKKYENTKGLKKIYVPFSVFWGKIITINGIDFRMAEFTENGFSVYENINPNLIGHTLHALSFDVDHGFIYLPTIKVVRSNRKNQLFYNETVEDDEKVTKFMNELNILFSRGRKSLNIFVNDIEAYLFLKARLPK